MKTVYQRTDYRGSGRSKCKRRNSDDAIDFTVTVTGWSDHNAERSQRATAAGRSVACCLPDELSSFHTIPQLSDNYDFKCTSIVRISSSSTVRMTYCFYRESASCMACRARYRYSNSVRRPSVCPSNAGTMSKLCLNECTYRHTFSTVW